MSNVPDDSQELRAAREEIRRFLQELEGELRRALDKHPDWFGDLHLQFEAAWSDIEPLFQQALGLVTDVKLEDLREHGLTGEQLALKMTLWDRARDRFHEEEGVRAWLKRRFPRTASLLGRLSDRIRRQAGLAHWFGALLAIANNILQSIHPLIPPAGAIKEFKDAVKEVVSAV